MTIGRDEVLKVARLAEIAVSEEELDRLVAQLDRIVAYVEQLSEVPAGEQATPYQGGPATVTLREDVVAPVPLEHPVSAFAPEFRDGLFLVPRRETMAAE